MDETGIVPVLTKHIIIMAQQFLVFVGGKPNVVTPTTNIVTYPNGNKTFWFYLNGKSIKAILPKGRNKWAA